MPHRSAFHTHRIDLSSSIPPFHNPTNGSEEGILSPNFLTMNVILLLVVACVGVYFFTDAKAKAKKH